MKLFTVACLPLYYKCDSTAVGSVSVENLRNYFHTSQFSVPRSSGCGNATQTTDKNCDQTGVITAVTFLFPLL